jgi:glycosyltransferase involved in cell wall biosynthesis
VQLSKELGLEKDITFVTFRQDVPDVLAAADIFVLPSLWEGLPIGLLEAMAMGKAIIASDVDGTGEVLKNGVNGVLIRTANLVDELTAALASLAQDPDSRKKFQERVVETINEKFNVITMTRAIETIYDDVLKGDVARYKG